MIRQYFQNSKSWFLCFIEIISTAVTVNCPSRPIFVCKFLSCRKQVEFDIFRSNCSPNGNCHSSWPAWCLGRHTNVFANASFTKWREANKKCWTGTILLLLQGLYCYCTIIVSNIFRYLTENYGKDARVTTIVDTTEVKWLHGYQFYQSDKICCTSIIIIIIITIITIIISIITIINMISGAFDSVNQSRRQRGVQSSQCKWRRPEQVTIIGILVHHQCITLQSHSCRVLLLIKTILPNVTNIPFSHWRCLYCLFYQGVPWLEGHGFIKVNFHFKFQKLPFVKSNSFIFCPSNTLIFLASNVALSKK